MTKVSDMPKQVMIARTAIQVQLGIKPVFTIEIVSMRTLKRKCIEVRPNHEDMIIAPNGYRIERMWTGTQPSTANEVFIQ